MKKHYLASANTCIGFYNCFKYINPNKKSFTYILKGGPGTGKSTIIKNFANNYINKNFDVEYFYCSSDINSLDGARITKNNIAIVDGTAPHITEATMPGIKEEIINVGKFIKPEIKKYKKIIEKNLQNKSSCYEFAYKYLKSAGSIIEIEQYENETQKKSSLIQLYKFLSLKFQPQEGSERKLFCSYITSNGIKNLYDKNKYKKIVTLNNNYFDNCQALNDLTKKLKEYNYNFISFLSVLNPNLIEGIYIEEIKTLVISFNISKDIIENFNNKNILSYLIKKAGSYIEKAKYFHKKVEKYYIKNMNFDALNKELTLTNKHFKKD